ELDGALGGLAVQGGSRPEVERLDRPRGLARPALPDLGDVAERALLRLVARIADPVPLVETLMGGGAASGVSDVPLAVQGGRVAQRLEQLGDRDLPEGHARDGRAVQQGPGPDAVPAGQERGAG